jgi:D-lactate dehydrogenase
MAKIAFYEVKKWEREFLEKSLKGHRLVFTEGCLGEKVLVKDADIISVFIHSKIDERILLLHKKLKMIATRSTGFDHIDLDACGKRQVRVCNVPNYGENTVAEHTFGLILALSRNIHKSYVRTLEDDFSIEGLTGFDLKGKTLGIVGGGRIGMHVARIARAFGMHVRVFDIRQDAFMADVLDFRYLPLDELLSVSDIVTLHVPHNRFTYHLINKESIRKMKKGAILVNTSRGVIVDTEALYEALRSGRLGGAGLDVIEGEELIGEEKELLQYKKQSEKWKTIVRDHSIFRMDNVVFTPHNAFNSREALVRILETTAENIRAFSASQPKNLVN